MSLPDYRAFMLPVLKASARLDVSTFGPVIQQVADDVGLTSEQRAELLPSGKQTVIRNRVAWAKFCLIKAGLLESVGWGRFKLTERGRSVLEQAPPHIDLKFLEQFPEWRQYIAEVRNGSQEEEVEREASPTSKQAPRLVELAATPDERLRSAHQELEEALAADLIERILASPPEFFERLIVSLLIKMNYGAPGGIAQAIGGRGDNGVDGVVDQDALGLDRVYVQAKRYKPGNSVGPGEIRDFSGGLDQHKASKGLFVTTSNFSSAAKSTADRLSRHIVMVDGRQLAKLMIKYSVGCRIEEALEVKRIDEEFFE